MLIWLKTLTGAYLTSITLYEFNANQVGKLTYFIATETSLLQ